MDGWKMSFLLGVRPIFRGEMAVSFREGNGNHNIGILCISAQSPVQQYPGIPTTIKTMGVNITTIVYLRVLIIEIGSTFVLMVVEAQGIYWKYGCCCTASWSFSGVTLGCGEGSRCFFLNPRITPQKSNELIPKNCHFQRELPFPNHHLGALHVSFRECTQWFAFFPPKVS